MLQGNDGWHNNRWGGIWSRYGHRYFVAQIWSIYETHVNEMCKWPQAAFTQYALENVFYMNVWEFETIM